MAATNYNANQVSIGPGTLWVIDVPAIGARITLAADGTPDSVAHPTAKHLGLTDAGSTFKTGSSAGEKIFADELKDAIRETEGEGSVTLTTTLLQVSDMDILVLLSPGQATKITGTGYEGVTFGSAVKTYMSVALIFPTAANPAKFEVIQLYKCSNTAGIEKAIQRKGIAKTPVTLEGLAIPSRPAADTSAVNWKQI